MITLGHLEHITAQKLKDAAVLLKNNRNGGCVYLAGYALEYSLKHKITRTLGFTSGFPDQLQEYKTYLRILNGPGLMALPTDIREIRNHNLNKLLFYSGAELTIRTGYLAKWEIVTPWNPENRYKIHRYSRQKAQEFLHGVKVIIQQLV
jgi:hypothetical protein